MPRPNRGKIVPQTAHTGGVMSDIRALNSSILLMTQKIKYVVRNEKILGRNLIVLNKKLKALEEKSNMPSELGGAGGASSEELQDLKKKMELMQAQLDDISSRMVSKEELQELKYIIDSINPLEFTTLSQVKEMIEKSKQ
jgi:vacuolar-type H+-ATPase subunit I/STV1